VGVTPPSSWPGVGHVVSRLPPATSRPFGLGFPSAPRQRRLTWLRTISRRIIMQKARGHPFPYGHRAPAACRRVVSGSVSSPGRGSSQLSLALLFAIGHQRVLSLAGWSPPLRAHFHVVSATQDAVGPPTVSPTGLSPAAVRRSRRFGYGLGSG
jgi:hypothetical protein